MIEFLSFPEETRRQLIDQVNIDTGLTQNAIEKDWWVTLVLKALFALPMQEHFIFKGGTSLSKGWGLIERFSEDIDIALDPLAFGKPYQQAASKNFVYTIKRMGCDYTSTVIFKALTVQLRAMGVPDEMIKIEVEEVSPTRPDKDPQTIYVHYRPLFEPSRYMLPRVKVEFGVRALREPFAPASIMSILGKEGHFPGYQEAPFTVTVVEPRKTFMEKMILLHEKFQNGQVEDMKVERQSRHLSDLGAMTIQGIAETVKADKDLYAMLIEHRRRYVKHKNTDYASMQLHQLHFLPPYPLLKAFHDDYKVMQEEMLYGDSPAFDMLMDTLRKLNRELAVIGLDCDINGLINTAVEQLGAIDGTQEVYRTSVDLYAAVRQSTDAPEKLASFDIEIIVTDKGPVAHRIIRIT